MRRTPVAVVLGAAALMLVACTPTIDLTAANEWAHAQFDAEKSQDDLLAMWVVTGSPEPATDDGDDGLDQYITTLGQRATVTGLRVRCFGGATMSVGVTVYTGSSAVGLGDEVECDEADHAIEVPGTLTRVHEITVRATAPVPTAGVVVVEGDTP